MAPSDDPADAAARLEEALDRIAHLAARRTPQAAPADDAVAVHIGERLDTLITQLRSALETGG